MTLNPYQPTILPHPIDAPDLMTSSGLDFDGVIEREDYSALLPNGTFLWWLQAILLIVLIPSLVLGLFIASASLIKCGATIESLFATSIFCLLLAIAALTVAAMGRRWRSRVHLARFPDLLGIAQGEFNKSGLQLHDGSRQHWFGPTVLSAAKISKVGIRVTLPGSPYRYLAFTERLFRTYNVTTANELHETWRKKAARPSRTELHPVANLWSPATEPPQDAVPFKGWCCTKEPLKTTETKQRAIIETLAMVGMLIVALTVSNDLDARFWAVSSLSVISVFSSFHAWRQYFYGTIDRSWYQYGWVSETQIAMCTNELGTIMERTEISSVELSDTVCAFTTGKQKRLSIFREQVTDEAAWLRLASMGPLATSGK